MFIHSSIDENLGCFYLLVLVNSAAMICMYKAVFECMFSILLVIYLEVELLSHITLYLIL